MNTYRKRLAVIAVAASASLILAGCGSSDSGSEETEAQTDEMSEATTESEETAAEESADGGEAEAAATDVVLSDAYSQALAEAAQTTVDTSEFAAEAPYKLATITQGPINGWGTIFDITMDKALEDSGVVDMNERIYAAWNGQTENQTKAMDDAIAAGVDGIILTSLSRAGLSASVDRATAAGIPVITCMAGVESPEYTAEVSRNIPSMGYSSMQALVDKLGGSGKVVLLHGIAGVDAAEFWKLGAEAALAEAPGIEVVSEQYGNWSTADATDVMRTVVAQQPEIDGIWVGGLEMGPGVVNAFQEAGRDVPPLAGTNPTNGFLRLAQENSLDFDAAPFPPGAAKVCVDVMINLLEGNPIQKFVDVKDSVEGTSPYGTSELEAWYVPDLNDDFIGPLIYDEQYYADNGFGR